VQIHLTNGLKITPTQSQILIEHLRNLQEIPNLKWLIHTATIYMNSGINNPVLWDIVEQHYLNSKFTVQSQATAEELLKLAFLMSSSQVHYSALWEKLIEDLSVQKDSLNYTQKVMLVKSLSKVEENSSLNKDFLANKFQPYLRGLIDSVLKNKEHLTLKELVGLLLSAEKMGMVKEDLLVKVEEKLFEKVEFLTKRHIYDLVKLYSKQQILSKERKEFMKDLRRVLISKFDEDITNSDANNFNIINNYMYKNRIINIQDYNDPYFQFIVDGKFKVFEYLYVSRMKTSSIMELINFSILVQGQLTKSMIQLSPETLLKVLNFFEIRGEVSQSFLELTLNVCKKYLSPVNEKHFRQQIYAYLIYAKFDPAHARGPRATKIAEDLVARLEAVNDYELKEEILRFTANNINELGREFAQVIKAYYKTQIHKLNEVSVYELFSIITEEDMKDNSLKEIVEDYLGQNFKYMKNLALCKSLHLIKLALPKEYTNLALDSISAKPLSLEEIEVLLRRSDNLPEELKGHISESFGALKDETNWQNINQVGTILLRILNSSQMFDKEFIQSLMGVVTAKQSYFNQKTLDKLITAYSKATNEQ